MFSDPVSFNGGTRVEVIAVLANCGRDTDRARRALVTWIRRKQDKGRSTDHILAKLRDVESKFIRDTSLHSAFRDARAETFLPRTPDLPLPSSIRKKSETRTSGSPASITTIPCFSSPSLFEPPTESTHRTNSTTSSSRLSQNSRLSEISGESGISRLSLPQGLAHAPPSSSPRIYIPRDRALQPGPSSPITSSPEDSGIHLRYRYRSSSGTSSYQSHGLMTPPSPSYSEIPRLSIPPRYQITGTGSRLSHGLASPLPSPRIQIPRTQPQRSIHNSNSPLTSSSEESDFRPRYRSMSQPIRSTAPGLRRLTAPTTSPPSLPLPPIPAEDQDVDNDSGTFGKNMPIDQPLTPAWSPVPHSFVTRPLPIQPIPSPVPSSDGSERADMISEGLLGQHKEESDTHLPLPHDIVRQDSPLYVFQDDPASPIGIEKPDARPLPDMPTIGDTLEKIVKEYGGAPEVRLEVSRCIGFQRGYEPPYWQSRLDACGLNSDAVRYLVDAMCKQVDWATSAMRASS